jgi:hypothetical protein
MLTVGKNDGAWQEATQTNGLLLMYRDARPGKESQVIHVR